MLLYPYLKCFTELNCRSVQRAEGFVH